MDQLTVAPTEVSITFTQEVQKVAGTYDLAVNKDRGPSVTAGPAVVNDADRTIMSVPLQADLADGRYVVRWKNVSDTDGDAAEGAFSFYLNYEPNAVDLENDNQLDQIGVEGTPTASTPEGEESVIATSEPTAGGGPATGPTAESSPDAGGEEDEGDSSSTLWVILGAVGIGIVAGGGAYVFARSRRGS
jgi:methionine-rich copper-binding protein CopC